MTPKLKKQWCNAAPLRQVMDIVSTSASFIKSCYRGDWHGTIGYTDLSARRLSHILLVLILSNFAAVDRSPGAEPQQIIRSLQQLQDQVVKGSGVAVQEQAAVLEQMASAFESVELPQWAQIKNIRAVVIYLVNGGSTRPVRKLVTSGAIFGVHQDIVEAMLAFADRQPRAAARLAKIDTGTLDRSIAASVALAQGISSLSEPVGARVHFAQARLLAPGTLIEEAALRREITMLLDEKKHEAALVRATYYLWKFPNSIYAGEVVTYLFTNAVPSVIGGSETPSAAALFIDQLPERQRVMHLLNLTRNALLEGRLQTAELANTKVLATDAADASDQAKAKAYDTIVKALTSHTGLDDFAAVERTKLGNSDLALLDAARAVAAYIRKVPTEDRVSGAVAGEDPSPAVVQARRSVAIADLSLTESIP